MKLVFLTPGTGSYYCGVCMRDNALAKELIRMGHDAVMLPMYLPLMRSSHARSSSEPTSGLHLGYPRVVFSICLRRSSTAASGFATCTSESFFEGKK